MSYTDLTLKKLFALSGNECAFPACTQPIVDTDVNVVVGEVCHIKGKSPNGPRYDPNQTDAARNGYENLRLMCGRHNKTVDDPRTRDKFTVERLQQFKGEHEEKQRNGIASEQALNTFITSFQAMGSVITTYNQSGGQAAHIIINHPPPVAAEASVKPKLEYYVKNVDNIAGIDYYHLFIAIDNDGETTVRDFRVNVEIPHPHMEGLSGYAAEVNSRTPSITRLFKYPVGDDRPNLILDPGERKPIFQLMFTVRKEQYLAGTSEVIRVWVYSDNRRVGSLEKPIAEMLNNERLTFFQGHKA